MRLYVAIPIVKVAYFKEYIIAALDNANSQTSSENQR